MRLVGSGAPSAGSYSLLDCQVAMARDAALPDELLVVFDEGAQLVSARTNASVARMDALNRDIPRPGFLLLNAQTRHLRKLTISLTVPLTMRCHRPSDSYHQNLSLPVKTSGGQEMVAQTAVQMRGCELRNT